MGRFTKVYRIGLLVLEQKTTMPYDAILTHWRSQQPCSCACGQIRPQACNGRPCLQHYLGRGLVARCCVEPRISQCALHA